MNHRSNISLGLYMILAVTVTATLSTSSAFADESPTFTSTPVVVTQGAPKVDLTWGGSASTDPHDIRVARVFQAGVIPTGGVSDSATSGGLNCAVGKKLAQTALADGPAWEARNAPGGPIDPPFTVSGLDFGESVTVEFKPGTASVTTSGTVTVSSASVVWVNITPGDATAPNLNVVGQVSWRSCGKDLGGAADWSHDEGILVQKPVAGEIIPIDTTALLVAGMSTNPLWILSSLALVAGGAFTLLRFQVSKKSL